MSRKRSWLDKGDGRRLTALAVAYLFGLHLLTMALVSVFAPAAQAASGEICALHAGAQDGGLHDPVAAKACLACDFCALASLPALPMRAGPVGRTRPLEALPQKPRRRRRHLTSRTGRPTPPRGPPLLNA